MSQALRPAFQIERVTGDFTFPCMEVKETTRTVYRPDGSEKLIPQRQYNATTRKATEAFMVYFPQGHSLCFDVNDTASLARYGLLEQAEMADLSELLPSDEVGNLPKTPKQIVAARMFKQQSRERIQGGLSTVDKM